MVNMIQRRKLMKARPGANKSEPKIKVRNKTGVGQWHGIYNLPADSAKWTLVPKSLAMRLAEDPQNYEVWNKSRNSALNAQELEECKPWEMVKRPRAVNALMSIVILGHNQYAYTEKCFNSILEYTKCRYEIVFVDNGSSDQTLQIPDWYPVVRYFRSETNLGVAGGRNFGLQKIKGQVVCILDNDIEVTPGWDQKLLSVLDSAPDIGMVGTHGCVLDDTGLDFIHVPRDTVRQCQVMVGQTQVFWADLLRQVGMIDDSMVWHEDSEFSNRIARAGYRLLCVPFDMPHRGNVTTAVVRKGNFRDRWDVDAEYMKRKLADRNEVHVHRTLPRTGVFTSITNDVIDTLRQFGYATYQRPTLAYSFPPIQLSSPCEIVIHGKRIGIYYVENDRASKRFAAGLDCDHVLCSSDHIYKSLNCSGVSKNKLVRCDTISIDTSVFHALESGIEEKPFRFLWVGASQPRKGVDLVLRAFERAFSHKDNVQLYLKDGRYGHVDTTSRMIARHPLKSKIIHDCSEMSAEALASLYQSASFGGGAFIHPHRGEGFGICPLEAAICGCRVGMTGWSAPTEFADDRTFTQFPYELKKSLFHNHPGEPFFDEDEKQPKWAEPNVDSIVEWMRQVVKAKCDSVDLLAVSKELSKKYSKKAVAGRFLDTIQRLTGDRPIKVSRYFPDTPEVRSIRPTNTVPLVDAFVKEYHLRKGHLRPQWNANAVLIIGCGMGWEAKELIDRGYPVMPMDTERWMRNNGAMLGKRHKIHDISAKRPQGTQKYHLVFSDGYFEHLAPDTVRPALRNISLMLELKATVLLVVDTIENPDFCKDPTHRTYRSAKWWKSQFNEIYRSVNVPESIAKIFPGRLILCGRKIGACVESNRRYREKRKLKEQNAQ